MGCDYYITEEILFSFICLFFPQSNFTLTAINTNDVKSIKIPFPPLPIQQEIVRILDSFTELIKELNAELDARRKQYEYYRELLLTFDNNVE